jgi:ABC-2 type transport system ATP-binding protein
MESVAAAGAAALEISDVAASYGKKRVLDGVSFSVAPGEVFGLVGLNGAGKTTLIRSVLSLRTAKGTIRIFGVDNTVAASRRKLIYLPEKFQPWSQLSGWEYLTVLLGYFSQALDKDRARAIAAGVDLDPGVLDRRIRTYSKGMGQKLGLAGTLLVDTPLMILDEPMSGLDPRARALLKDRLKEHRHAGRAIFFSSHILADIEEICDRIGVLHGGEIIFLGTPQEFLARHPAATLERAFLTALEETEKTVAA